MQDLLTGEITVDSFKNCCRPKQKPAAHHFTCAHAWEGSSSEGCWILGTLVHPGMSTFTFVKLIFDIDKTALHWIRLHQLFVNPLQVCGWRPSCSQEGPHLSYFQICCLPAMKYEQEVTTPSWSAHVSAKNSSFRGQSAEYMFHIFS